MKIPKQKIDDKALKVLFGKPNKKSREMKDAIKDVLLEQLSNKIEILNQEVKYLENELSILTKDKTKDKDRMSYIG